MYNILTDRLHSVDPSDGLGVPDTMWLERKTKEVKAEMEALEGQLKQYKNNLIKESIRVWPIVRVTRQVTDMRRWAMTTWDNSTQASAIITRQ